MSMTHANRLSRGDLRRNARLERLRRVVSHDRAVLAVDLANDKQVAEVSAIGADDGVLIGARQGLG
jgi:hypothetical protein